MKNIYLLLMVCFLFSGNTFASSRKKSEKNYKEMYEFYQLFKTGITDERMLTAVYAHKEDPNDKDFLDVCIASYICSDEEIREVLEEELGKNDKAIKIARDILSNVKK